ncbi:hypothetical protein D3C86_874870 [compost metagenome]
MRTENPETYGQSDRDFHFNESVITDPQSDENSSYVDEYESNKTDTNYDPNEEIVNEEDSITNDQDNLYQEFLDALEEDEDKEIYDDQNNLDKGDPNAYDDGNLDIDDLYENEDADDDLEDNNLNDLEGDHLNNPDLDREEQNIRNKDSSKVD